MSVEALREQLRRAQQEARTGHHAAAFGRLEGAVESFLVTADAKEIERKERTRGAVDDFMSRQKK